MNLAGLTTRVRSLIREPRENHVLDDEIHDWLNDMSFESTKELNFPWDEEIVHCIEDTADYALPTDFIKYHPLLNVFFDQKKADKFGGKWIEYNYPQYQKAESQTQPSVYYTRYHNKISIYPPPSLIAEGTATAGSGLATLIDSAAAFGSDLVGRSIRNVTDGNSYGLITAVTSVTQLTAALTGGTADVWADGDEYKINVSGTIPSVYKEATMVDDGDESLIAEKFPYLLVYKVAPLAEIKAFRTDPAAQFTARNQRYDSLYASEFLKAKKQVNEFVRGNKDRTISPVKFLRWKARD